MATYTATITAKGQLTVVTRVACDVPGEAAGGGRWKGAESIWEEDGRPGGGDAGD